MFSGCGITFDGAVSWSFGDEFARNVVTFDFDKIHHLIQMKDQLITLMEALV